MTLNFSEPNTRVLHLLDFEMTREYVVRNEGKTEIRRHQRNEQGRCNDLWSMIYLLVEMRGLFPWSGIR